MNTRNRSNPQPCRGDDPTRKGANAKTVSPSSRRHETRTLHLPVVIANREIEKLPETENTGIVWAVEAVWGKLRGQSTSAPQGQAPAAEWMLLRAMPPRAPEVVPPVPAANQPEAQTRHPQHAVRDGENLNRRMALRRAKLWAVTTMPNDPSSPTAPTETPRLPTGARWRSSVQRLVRLLDLFSWCFLSLNFIQVCIVQTQGISQSLREAGQIGDCLCQLIYLYFGVRILQNLFGSSWAGSWFGGNRKNGLLRNTLTALQKRRTNPQRHKQV